MWHLVERKFENVVATMGSDLGDGQEEIIAKLVTRRGRIWFIPDGDTAGERFANSAVPVLSQSHFVQWVKLESGKQPTDYKAGFFEERMSK